MAHETGSASDPIDLLDKLRLFCIAQGSITFNEFRNEGTAPGKLLSVSLGSGFFSIGYVVADEAYMLTQATAFNASTAWGSQPDETDASATRRCWVNDVPDGGAISIYHFTYFVGGVVMVSINTPSGAWRHFCFGDIEKYGTYTGGSVIMGHHVNLNVPYNNLTVYFGMRGASIFNEQRGGYLRLDDGATVVMRKIGFASANPTGENIAMNAYSTILKDSRTFGTSPATPTQASSLMPMNFAVEIAPSSSKHSPVGTLRDIRHCNIQLLDNEQVFDTDWLVFSQGIKNDPDEVTVGQNNGFIGIAVRVQ